MARAKMTIYYDKKHSQVRVGDMAYIKLTTTLGKGYRIPYASTLDATKVGPFKVIGDIDRLAFRLELPAHMKIHPVISVVHLEPASPDPYNRTCLSTVSLTSSYENNLATGPENGITRFDGSAGTIFEILGLEKTNCAKTFLNLWKGLSTSGDFVLDIEDVDDTGDMPFVFLTCQLFRRFSSPATSFLLPPCEQRS